MEEVTVNFKRTDKNAATPTYATDGSGAFDIYSSEDCEICPGKTMMVDTGLRVAIPKGYMMIIAPRSSIGVKTGLRMPHSVGLIDSDYRGNVKVVYQNTLMLNALVHKGDRIAQGFLLPKIKVNFVEVDELDETERGEGGFGSTGK